MIGRPSAAMLAAMLLTISACSPGAAAPLKKMRAGRTPASHAKTSGKIQREIVANEAPPPARAAEIGGERRCGWLSNPSPGDWWLFDGHGERILSALGGPRARGFGDMPDMRSAGWVKTSRHSGYGCACMIVFDRPGSLYVARIAGAEPKPLKQCRADRALPHP